jgi:hypothetical protein
VVEGARLESEYTAKPYRGFESLPLRQIFIHVYSQMFKKWQIIKKKWSVPVHARPFPFPHIRNIMWEQMWERSWLI